MQFASGLAELFDFETRTFRTFPEPQPGAQLEPVSARGNGELSAPHAIALGLNTQDGRVHSLEYADEIRNASEIVRTSQRSPIPAFNATSSLERSPPSMSSVQTLAVTALLSEIRELPEEHNSLWTLMHHMRSVIESLGRITIKSNESHMPWDMCEPHNHYLADNAFFRGKMDHIHQTTLGLILQQNLVINLLPGGPAFLAGLRKGDSIVEVITATLQKCLWDYQIEYFACPACFPTVNDDIGYWS